MLEEGIHLVAHQRRQDEEGPESDDDAGNAGQQLDQKGQRAAEQAQVSVLREK